jgi:hypothetical protein
MHFGIRGELPVRDAVSRYRARFWNEQFCSSMRAEGMTAGTLRALWRARRRIDPAFTEILPPRPVCDSAQSFARRPRCGA